MVDKIALKKPVELLSKHLFWDTPINQIEIEKNKGFIVHRVLEYGLWSDWQLIRKWYGIDQIGHTISIARPKGISFFSKHYRN